MIFCRRSPVKFWTRIFGFSWRRFLGRPPKFLGKNLLPKFWERIFFRSFGGEFGKSLGSIRLLSLLPPSGFGAPVWEPPPLGSGSASVLRGGDFYPSGEDASTSTTQARRRKNFETTAAYQPPHVLGSPPSVSLRVMAPSEFPRGRGLCPSGGACSPWGLVLGFLVGSLWTLP